MGDVIYEQSLSLMCCQAPPCANPDICVTSAPSCDASTPGTEKKCPKLETGADTEAALWTCASVNPYKEDVPSGTHCELS